MSEYAGLDDVQPADPAPPEMFPCDVPGCGASYPTQQGVSMHKNRSHGIVSTTRNAARKRESRMGADEAFELTGAALDVLFPNGIPASRIIEIAELQKHMLKVVA